MISNSNVDSNSSFDFIRPRIVPLFACLLSVLVCLAYAKYRDVLPDWWRSHGGGVPYVLFWILFVYCLIPNHGWIGRICVVAVIGTCGLEVLQLWSPEPLASFRKTKFGAALLGSTFVWKDFPPYFIGGGLGYMCLLAIEKMTGLAEGKSGPVTP